MKYNSSSMFKSGTRRRLAGAIWLLLSLGLLVAMVLPAVPALATPNLPHCFWGSVTINGVNAPVGTMVYAKINGVSYADCAVDSAGKYSVSVPGDDPDEVFGPGIQGGVNGDIIHFFVGNVEAATATFITGGPPPTYLTVLNLAITQQLTYGLTVNAGSCCPINVSGGAQGTIEAGGSHQYTVNNGATVILQAMTTACSVFDGWEINGSAQLNTANPLQTSINCDTTITAHCTALGPYNLKVTSSGCCPITVSGGAIGTVAAGNWQNFSVNCGSQVTLTATTSACCTAVGWVVDSAPVQGNPITVSMNQAHEAVFTCTVVSYTVNTSVLPEGSGTVSGGGSYNCGSTATLQASANPGWEFTGWSGDLSGAQNPADLQVTGSNKSVVANFTQVGPDLSIPGAILGIPLDEGWNTFSIPIKLDSNGPTKMDTWGEFKALNGLQADIMYRYAYDSSLKVWLWQQVANADVLQPLEGYYVKMAESGLAQIVPNEGQSGPPAKSLIPGLNLIGVASLVDVDLASYLFTIYDVPSDGGFTTGYTLVHNPPINTPNDWSNNIYLRGGSNVPTMKVGKAYWVNMQHPGDLVGRTSTPLTH